LPNQQFGLLTSSPLRDYEDIVVCQAVLTKKEKLALRAEREAAMEPEAKAILRFARGSPNKMRRVIDTIRGRTYEDALVILEYLPYRATEPILKTLLSAAANASHNLGMKKTRLYVSTCYVDAAPTFKRFRCRAKGQAAMILKRNSHITIKLKEKSQEQES